MMRVPPLVKDPREGRAVPTLPNNLCKGGMARSDQEVVPAQ